MKLITHYEPRQAWNPFREMDALHQRLASLFSLPAARVAEGAENVNVAHWSPLVDITEDEKEYTIKAELPEVKREDVAVRVEDGVLSITGERKSEKEEKGKRYHRVERSYGRFVRSFTLPDDANGDQVAAEFKEGVLQVHLPKNEQAKPKTIEVKVA